VSLGPATGLPAPGDPLSRLAEAYGLLPGYHGTDGTWQAADPGAVVAVLDALGAGLSGPSGAADVLAGLEAARADRVLEPVLVHRPGPPAGPVTVTLPRGVAPRDCWLTVRLAGAEPRRVRLSTAVTRPLGTSSFGGRRRDGYEVELGHHHRPPPPGRHSVRVEGPAGLRAGALLLSAPRCPEVERSWGAFLPLHALRGAEDRGTGTYPDLGRLARGLAQRGASFLGTLPLGPIFCDRSFDPSPYLPVSRLALNELFVDPAAAPELAAVPEGAEALATLAPAQAGGGPARRPGPVDHRARAAALGPLLAQMAAALRRAGGSRAADLDRFAEERPELAAYARFRAARDGGDWPPAGPRAALPDDLDPAAVDGHLYAQWLAEEQLAGAAADGAALYLDLPLGVHPEGFDPWWDRRSFAAGLEVGAPPDEFQPAGQRWGFAPPHPEGIRQSGYRYLSAVVAQACRHAGLVRLDHVMGLHRLYLIPPGYDATAGVYLCYRAAEQRAVVCLEAAQAGTAVVGEDLGTVPDQVRGDLHRDGMLRSFVVQFEATEADPLPTAPEECLASWGTHDLPRLAAFLEGRDLDDAEARGQRAGAAADAARRRRAGLRRALLTAAGRPPGEAGDLGPLEAGDERAVLEAVLGALGRSPARAVLVDLEDLLGEREPQNRPGTGPEAGNWVRRARRTLEQLLADDDLAGLLGTLDHARREEDP
jgi:4-alpha-glucanotransferase